MPVRRWETLPEYMKNEKVRSYYELLSKKWFALAMKRVFDFIVALVLLLLLWPVLLAIAVWIKLDSKGPVIFKQTRVTRAGKRFLIWKFRTMVADAEQRGSAVTTLGDARITRAGSKLRGCRLDELPQLFNILFGDMSFVGTRPEAVKYVEQYSDEMFATLLLPAGVTCEASIRFKDEDRLLADVQDVDAAYVNEILPKKMAYNLDYLKHYSFLRDIRLMFATVFAVAKSED